MGMKKKDEMNGSYEAAFAGGSLAILVYIRDSCIVCSLQRGHCGCSATTTDLEVTD